MAKAYWVVCYRSVSDPTARENYSKLGAPAVLAAGGRFLTRGIPAKTYENGIKERTVVIEFDSLAPHTIVRRIRRHSPLWATERSATCGSSKASTVERGLTMTGTLGSQVAQQGRLIDRGSPIPAGRRG